MAQKRSRRLSKWGRELEQALDGTGISKDEVAHRLEVSESTLFRWMASGPPKNRRREAAQCIENLKNGTTSSALPSEKLIAWATGYLGRNGKGTIPAIQAINKIRQVCGIDGGVDPEA